MNKKIKAGILVTLQFGILGALVIDSHFSKNTTYIPASTFAMLFGLTVILVAYFNLRPSVKISPIPKSGAPFIANGIYKFVRHPMYLGVLSIGVSLSANANNLLGWILWLWLLATLKIKSKFEDSLLREIHPEAFHYQTHTSAILPCLGGSCRENCNLRTN